MQLQDRTDAPAPALPAVPRPDGWDRTADDCDLRLVDIDLAGIGEAVPAIPTIPWGGFFG